MRLLLNNLKEHTSKINIACEKHSLRLKSKKHYRSSSLNKWNQSYKTARIY